MSADYLVCMSQIKNFKKKKKKRFYLFVIFICCFIGARKA